MVEAHGPEATARTLGELMEAGEIRPHDFSFLELGRALLSEQQMVALAEGRGNVFSGEFQEADSYGVGSSGFLNITGQIIYNALIDKYESINDGVENLVSVTKTQFLDGEKIAGITTPRGEVQEVLEGMPYPEAGIGEDYINTPATEKYGTIVSLTAEAILKDRTGLILDRAASVGERVAYRKASRIWDCIFDLNTKYRYKWKGTTYSPWQTASPWINDASSQELTDWTSIEHVMVQMADIANPDQPDTTEPINLFQPKVLVVMPFKEFTARRILSATEIRQTTNTNNLTLTGNPIPPGIQLVSSAFAYQRLIKSGVSASNAKNYWLLGDPQRAIKYMEVLPLTVVQAPPNSELEFSRDVVARWKAAERGVPVWVQPRAMARRYVA
jgi:hypothetical protein